MTRFHKFIIWTLCIMIIFGSSSTFQAIAENTEDDLTEEWKLKSRTETFNRVVTIGDKSFVYYAQNSPEYEKIWVGEGYTATVGGNTCACFALANALVNTVEYSSLPLVREIATSPIKIDTHNIFKGMGTKESLSFEIDRNEDFFRYLPLAIINIAGGNNSSYGRNKNFASAGYYKQFINKFGLALKQSKDLDVCVEEIKNNNAVIIVCTGSAESPIANKFGHYMLMVDVKDDKVYFLDSFLRDQYDKDKKGIIHIQEPGIIWVNKQDLKSLCLYGTKYIIYPSEQKQKYTQEKYNEIIALSNTRIESSH